MSDLTPNLDSLLKRTRNSPTLAEIDQASDADMKRVSQLNYIKNFTTTYLGLSDEEFFRRVTKCQWDLRQPEKPCPIQSSDLEDKVRSFLAVTDPKKRAMKSAALSKDYARNEIWATYDQYLNISHLPARLDYRFWRLTERPLYLPPATRAAWGDPFDLATCLLQQPNPIISWGGLMVLTHALTGGVELSFTAEQQRTLAQMLRTKLSTLKYLAGAKAGCAAIHVAILDTVQKIEYEHTPGQLQYQKARDYVDEFCEVLTSVDPTWRPGKALSVEAIFYDRPRILPLDPLAWAMLVHLFFFRAREAARYGSLDQLTQSSHNGELQNGLGKAMCLLNDGFSLSHSSYRTARSQVKSHKQGGAIARHTVYTKTEDAMFRTLAQTCVAARDAGEHLVNGKLGHRLLWTIPPYLRNGSVGGHSFEGIATQISGSLRELGLTVPSWAENSKPAPKETIKRPPAATPTPQMETVENSTIKPIEGRDVPEWTPRTGSPYDRLLAIEWEQDVRWKKLTSLLPDVTTPWQVVKKLWRQVNKFGSANVSEDILRAAFELFLKHGWLNSAMNLVDVGFNPSLEETLDLAHVTKRIQQHVWFGLDFGVHEQWGNTLRTAWRRIRADSLTKDQALVMHETLSGRLSSMMTSISDDAASHLFSQMAKTLTDDQVTAMLEGSKEFQSRAAGIINYETLGKTAEALASRELGRLVFVSLVSLGENEWSLFASDGQSWPELERHQVNVETAEAERCLNHAFFLLTHHGRDDELAFNWPSGLRELAGHVLRISREASRDVKWIVLAVDRNLARFPWQALLQDRENAEEGGPGQSRIVVSLVPNLGWAGLLLGSSDDRRPYKTGCEAKFGDELDEPDHIELVSAVQVDVSHAPETFDSLACMVAHGKLLGNALPSVKIRGKEWGPEEWCAFFQRRQAVLHICWGGVGESGVLGDFGGLPTCALGNGCRTLLAPVVEIPPWAARKLHEKLFTPNDPETIGLQYLAAIEECPAVSLYNLYGLASETRT